MSKIKIPFDSKGQQDYPTTYTKGFHWKDNFEFYDFLTYQGYRRGRSAIGFIFKGTDEQTYSMFMTDMDKIIHKLEDGKIAGNWTFVKRGQSYGIRLID